MNQVNRRIVQHTVKRLGEILEGRLPPVAGLQRRNPWAHLWDLIGRTMGNSYKDCDDTDLPTIMAALREEASLHLTTTELQSFDEG